jgi:hypothetical protein
MSDRYILSEQADPFCFKFEHYHAHKYIVFNLQIIKEAPVSSIDSLSNITINISKN